MVGICRVDAYAAVAALSGIYDRFFLEVIEVGERRDIGYLAGLCIELLDTSRGSARSYLNSALKREEYASVSVAGYSSAEVFGIELTADISELVVLDVSNYDAVLAGSGSSDIYLSAVDIDRRDTVLSEVFVFCEGIAHI